MVQYQDVEIPVESPGPARTTRGRLYSDGPATVILSNMNTNDQTEWAPVIEALTDRPYRILTYDYLDPESDQWTVLAEVMAFAQRPRAGQMVLVGASRGGVTSMQVLAGRARIGRVAGVAGVAAISSPVEHEGRVFFEPGELSKIAIPKLLINTLGDECAEGTREMYAARPSRKKCSFTQAGPHGTEIFSTPYGPEVIEKLTSFIESVLAPKRP